jgi:hypothetical protein
MSADLRNYFLQAQEEANDNFFNYDGYDYDDDDDFDGDDYFEGDDDWDMASGGNSAPTSQPYIIVIKNTATATAQPVTILGAYNTLKFNAVADPVKWQNATSISISMGISGITYAEFLYQSMNKPFVCGLTYYQASSSITGNAESQILETLTLISRDVNGNETQKTLVPTIDPYQQQNSVIAIKFSYKVDGFTSIVISQLLGGTTAKLYFYPAETSSVARTLTGRKAVSGYGSPHIIKQDKLTLSSGAMRKLSGRGRRRRR